jgi:hypothetical protein
MLLAIQLFSWNIWINSPIKMRRLYPSQVVEIIDSVYPHAKSFNGSPNPWPLSYADLPRISPIVDATKAIPDELITLTGQDFILFHTIASMLDSAIKSWQTQGNSLKIDNIPGHKGEHPIVYMRRVLTKCSDEAPGTDTPELKFINDDGLRQNLRIDIAAVNRALLNGEWKATTVLAGSICEALLLWAISQRKNDPLVPKEARKPEEWDLHKYILVAENLKLISVNTVTQTRLAKDYRNLIHPGRAIRLQQKCDRATSLSPVSPELLALHFPWLASLGYFTPREAQNNHENRLLNSNPYSPMIAETQQVASKI